MTVYLDDGDARFHVGDALDVLRTLPDESVHMCATSPPFYGLRDYGVEGQIGLEASPDEWVARLVAVFREVRRVLRGDGTLWLECGDIYASNGPGGTTGSTLAKGGRQPESSRGLAKRTGGCKPKDLIGAPWLLAFALRADGWYLRSEIVWAKPNPMPESVTDRPTTAHSRVFLLAKSARYLYDAEAVREDFTGQAHSPGSGYDRATKASPRDSRSGRPAFAYLPSAETLDGSDGETKRGPDGRRKTTVTAGNGSVQHRDGERWPGTGRNKRSVWTIATEPNPEPHYAAWPQKLVEPMILAGTSERGCCPECGAPWERVVARGPNIHPGDSGRGDGYAQRARRSDGKAVGTVMRQRHEARGASETVGWQPTCDHELDPAPCRVLDCFAGTGTTLLVARRLGRHSLGIDLSSDYAAIAARRLSQLSLLTETSR